MSADRRPAAGDLCCSPGAFVGATLRVPGDKSISHRALLLGAFTPGPTRIAGLNRGSAVEALFTPLEQLGARFTEAGGELEVAGIEAAGDGERRLEVGASSAAARLLLGVLAGLGRRAVIDGDATLRRRPMEWLVEPLRQLGAEIEELGAAGRLPLALRGGRLIPGQRLRLRIGSAQARSGVLLATVFGRAPATIHYPVRSRDHTERLLRHAGAHLEEGDVGGLWIAYRGGELRPLPLLEIPGDPSLAAYPVAACLLAGRGSRVEVLNVCLNPTRTAFFDVLARAGAAIRYEAITERHGEPVGRVVAEGGLDGVAPLAVDDAYTLHAMIDEVPLLCAVAARLPGRSTIRCAEELSFKETDRLRTTRDMLRAFGAEVTATASTLTVDGGRPLHGGSVPSFADHRIAMSAATLATALPGVTRIAGGACVATSFPGFPELLGRLGCRVEIQT